MPSPLLLILLFFSISAFLHHLASVDSEILTSDLAAISDIDAPKAEELANKTYAQEQSDLQMAIFKNYDRKVRPVRNQSSPTTVLFHAYLMHFSVDQLQQTLLLNGHIYMTWTDEMAVWDPANFNNVRTTMAKQWELWQPDLRVANSVSGVNQYFEISKRSHATLTSISANRTKVECYPTFRMKIGCNFDFSDYPFDEQSCAARLYTANVMSEVELSIYYNLEPSVMLGWGNQSAKRHVSDWELVAVQANLSFYRNRKYSSQRPLGAFEAQSTWSLLLLGLRVRRCAPLFWLCLALPALCCSLLNVLSFLLSRPEHSVGLVLVNLFLNGILVRDAIRALPPSVGDPPRIVLFSNLLLFLTLFCLLLHLSSRPITRWLIGHLSQHHSRQSLPTLLLPLLNLVVFTDDDGCADSEMAKKVNEQERSRADDDNAANASTEEEEATVACGSGRARKGIRRRLSPLALFRLCCALLLLLVTVPLLLLLVFGLSAGD